MGFIVAIEPDPKTVKDIKEEWAEIARSSDLKIVCVDSIESLKKEWLKPDYAGQPISLIMVAAELLGEKPVDAVNAIKTTYNCEILVSIFDHPKFTKGIETWPVQNFIFKPFDKTILKEHTRFALLNNQKVKTIYVHTTAAKAEIESLKKFKMINMTEAGFRLNKAETLVVGQAYKFYHPMFGNGKQQHIWARVLCQTDAWYELLFCQVSPAVLGQIRRKIVGTPTKAKGVTWSGRTTSVHTRLLVCLHLEDDALIGSLQDLLNRSFDMIQFIDKKNLKPNARNLCDLLITDQALERRQLEQQFYPAMTYVHVVSKPLDRAALEARFSVETVRLEKPIDKAVLVKIVRQLFPNLKEKEASPLISINIEDQILLSTMMEVEEYSEAAMTFKKYQQIPRDTMLDITLSQEDETTLKEMKAKVHYVSEKPGTDKFYEHQVILFGVKDEFLKLIRLWTLQQHIAKNQKQA